MEFQKDINISAQNFSIQDILEQVVRRAFLIALCILAAASIGLGYYLKKPKVYEGSALLSYQQQKINPARMSPDEGERIRDIVSTLTEIVTSRSRLEKLITQEDLYPELRAKLPMEDVVAAMERNIVVAPARQGDTVKINFTYAVREKVAKVTNAIAAALIEENMKYREEKASETSVYTSDELKMAKDILDSKEAVMRDYKLKYYNEMPDRQQVNIQRLTALQQQYQDRQESIQDLERTRLLIRDQIEVRRQLLNSAILETSPATGLNTGRSELARLERELLLLQDKYTDLHPKIRSLKSKIEKLKNDSLAQKQMEGVDGTKNVTATRSGYDEVLFDLERELKSIALNIDALKNERVSIAERIKEHEQWVAAAPVREAEWSALTREYGELKRHYDYLVAQNLQAESALNLERKQKGSQFKFVETAVTPVKPISPNFVKIMGAAAVVGGAVGGGIAFLFLFLSSSFRDPDKLEKAFDIEVICTVPRLKLREEIIRHRLVIVFNTILCGSWSVGLGGVIIYLWRLGKIVI